MEGETGEDPGRLRRGRHEHRWRLDLAVQKAAYASGNCRRGIDITVANLGQLALPATLEPIYEDGMRKPNPPPSILHRRSRMPIAATTHA